MKIITVLNLGAGVQSTWMRLNVPHDVAIFADARAEAQWTYDHVRWLMQQPGPPIIVADAGDLEHDLIYGIPGRNAWAPSLPAYTAEREGVPSGSLPRRCTGQYKVKPIMKVIREELLGLKPRERIPRNVQIRQLYGITIDEIERAQRMLSRVTSKSRIIPVFPLVERRMTRQHCIEDLRKTVPHEVRRSACVFCPYRSDAGWIELRTLEPQSWERAVRLDEKLREPGTAANRKLRHKMYLHNSCVPLSKVVFKHENQRRLFNE